MRKILFLKANCFSLNKLLIFAVLLAGIYGCRSNKNPPTVPHSADYNEGYRLFAKNPDSAFFYFNKVVTESRDSQLIASAYTNMAMIQSDAGDYFGAQESLISSLQFFNENNPTQRPYQAQNYSELAITSIKLKNYDEAISSCNQALALTRDSSFQTTILNNQANAYRYKKNYRSALELYRKAISLTKNEGKPYARILTNYAITKWLDSPGYNPVPELNEALHIRIIEKDLWGQNSSYAHLADYYHSQPDSALVYANRMHQIARRLGSPDDEIEALQKLIEFSPNSVSKNYFSRYEMLSDSLKTRRNAAKNQFALIRFNTEKHKADNLKLQKDNADQNSQIIKQWAIILIIVIFAIAGGIIYRQRSRRKQAETEAKAQQQVQEYQLNTSKKIHDVVANGLYQVMTEIEHQPELDKDLLATRIDVLYKQSRAISYNKPFELIHQDFHQEITDMLDSFSSSQTTFLTAGHNEQTWAGINISIFNEIKTILLELLINMKKHSQADRVVLKFLRDAQGLRIKYHDNGIGLPEPIPLGNGLTNTGNRIKAIHGSITFGTNNGGGLLIEMSMPIV